MFSPLAELQAGANDQVLHGSRHEDFARAGCCGDTRGNVDGARLVELPSQDHLFVVYERIGDCIEEFLTGSVSVAESERVLATVLFTDIVGSTSRAEQIGDHRWHNLLDAHHATVRRELARYRGSEVKSLGDGFLATFDGPARAVRCACAIAEAVRPLHIEVRCGLHTGEVEIADRDVQGIATPAQSMLLWITPGRQVRDTSAPRTADVGP